jgi:hypothetical protein
MKGLKNVLAAALAAIGSGRVAAASDNLQDAYNKLVAAERVTHKSTTHEERYLHGTASDGRRYTVFMRNLVPVGTEAPPVWHRSVAVCSRDDTFSRAVGRSVARRRWFQGKRELVEDVEKWREVTLPTEDGLFAVKFDDIPGEWMFIYGNIWWLRRADEGPSVRSKYAIALDRSSTVRRFDPDTVVYLPEGD